ncbi:winged helix-turn-helix transcriptional regulator [Diaphorobacter ruginosibacter]|uniref:Winged helix-turn-helix transcriptional regulator n=1 Tax=Diaphorobacter ruginosibacter TaxID=1715720 RepID=A0A7G9RU27_9BURK|nr:winged helix-turn-helix transcriptional regulator [Diaphorobacter ruginosibacter]QNN59102.1 winged helix-turn-helix transcriptional regulator [Diaphorobacter ruginosibacter]
MSQQPEDIDLTLVREALDTSTLSHGLKIIGDHRTAQVVLGAFVGKRRFDDWLASANIPRHTLAERLKSLVQMDVLRPRLYQERPERYAYHLTTKGMALYDSVLMIWDWEQKYGERNQALPPRLTHKSCGHVFHPDLACSACNERVTMQDLSYELMPNAKLPYDSGESIRTPRLRVDTDAGFELGLRVDRWSLLIIAAVTLGCHYFDQLSYVLRIGPGVLSKRLASMAESNLLVSEADHADARRKRYRLTPASRGLFGYIVCLSTWAGTHHFREPSSIRPTHKDCGQPFIAQVTCSHCHQVLKPWDVTFDIPQGSTT